MAQEINKEVENKEVQEAQKEQKEQPNKRNKNKPKPKKGATLIHIDEFIEAIRPIEDLNPGKANGFKAYMLGNHYLPSLDAFVPYLERYIGKDVR